ncbi:MAG TPA: EAL domain-containing protein [Burkholderiales bacterium]|nr:EAL domain-containing protein [Burkholderiales bacterium]
MRTGSAELRDWIRQPTAWAILAVGVVLSAFTWRSLTLEVDGAARASFERVVAEARNTIDARARDYRIVLYGLQGLFHAGREVNRTGFHRYVESLGPERSARLRSLSYAVSVTAAGKSAYEESVRRDASLHAAAYPAFAIKPPGQRERYLPVHYLEPFAGNQAGFGLDLFADPLRREAVERARDSGRLIASAPFNLVSAPNNTGSALRLAVYRPGATLDGVDSRRGNFAGVVSLTFRVADLAEDVVSLHSGAGLQLQIFDDGQRIYDSGAESAGDAFLARVSIDVGGRPWQLQFSAPPQRFRTASDAALPWLALSGGLVITVLLSGLVGSFATSTRRAQRIAATITEDLRESEARLAESQQRTQKLIETLPNPVFFKGTDGRYLGVNQAWEQFFGTRREQIVGKTVYELYPHDRGVAQRLSAMDTLLWQTPGTQVYETPITLANGAHRDTVYYKATFTGPDGKVAGLIGNIIDVTEQKRAERRLRMEHAVTRVLAEAESTQAGLKGVMRAICEAEGWDCARVYLIDGHAGVLRFSEAWGIDHAGVTNFIERTRDMVFSPGQGLAGRAWQTGEPVWSGDISADPRATRRFASDYGMRGSFVLPVVSAGKTLGVVAFASRVVREPDARLLEAAGVVGSQVGQFLIRKQAEEAVRFVATHDELTKLPNRVMFAQRLEHALSQAARHGRRLAVLFIDLDRFKIINDTLGHDVGDALLREVARRLTESLRASDTVARLGGDEFVVLLEDLSDPLYVTAVAHKLLAALAQPVVLGGREYHVTASIGASAYPDDSADAQALLKNADIAMYRAKEQGRNTFQFYSAQLNLHTVERLTLESGLRRALERNELLLHFQPQVELRSGRITGVEALVRWQHPEHGLLPPGRFIGIAEETGLIVPIGNWVLQTACAAHRAWRRQGLRSVRLSVNLSARQFLHDHLTRDIRSLVGDDGFAPGRLELEITESMVMHDPNRAVALLHELRQIGVRVSIDDFGTGHSSLAYLKRFPIDSLKIDRSFISGVPDDLGDVAITHAVIAMAHNLGMKVIAEGVETRLQRDFLAAQGCDEYQGYFFSAPVSAEELQALLSPPAKPKSSRASS